MSDCIHRWVIAMPNGPTSPGVCRHCGAQREFKNSEEALLDEQPGGARERYGKEFVINSGRRRKKVTA